MFDKLLRNLPFNPSLIDQVTFYGKRLSKEAGVRRAGFILIALTMALQLFATMSPAKASVACDPSNNDIVQCGFTTQAQAVSDCQKNIQNYQQILAYYGITCAKVAAATEKTVSSTAYGNQLISVGRKAFNKPGEYSVDIPSIPGQHFFWRPLSSWGTFSSKMLVTQTDDGQLVMLMFECGNLVTLKDYKLKQPQPDSALKVLKANSPQGEVKSGDTIDYTLAFTNTGGPALFFSVNDVLPNNVTLVSSQYGDWTFENKAPNLKWYNNTPYNIFGNTDALGTPGFITVKTRVNDNVPSGTTICNRAYVQDVNKDTAAIRNSSDTQVCNTVVKTCPEGQVLQDDRLTCVTPAVPDAVCVSLVANPATDEQSNKKFTFNSVADTSDGASIQSYTYNFGDGTTKTNGSSQLKDSVDHEFSTPATYDVSVKVQSSVPDKPTLTCHTKAVVNPPETKPIVSIKKSAANLTKGQSDANGQTASAGDTIEYTLTTSNISDVAAKDYALQPEDLGDVLEYADLDMTRLDGGVFDAQTKTLSWNAPVTIAPHSSITKVIRVTVKSPIPSTPRPDTENNKSSGDLVMHNWYGNPIDIKLPTTPVKITEQVTTNTLVKTGPGPSLVIGFLTMTIVGYFFARSRLLSKELELVKQEYTTSGGL